MRTWLIPFALTLSLTACTGATTDDTGSTGGDDTGSSSSDDTGSGGDDTGSGSDDTGSGGDDTGDDDGLQPDGPCDLKPVLAGCTASYEAIYPAGSEIGTMVWNDEGLLVSTETPTRRQEYAYDAEGRLTSMDYYGNDGTLSYRVETTYDSNGQPSKRERLDPEGNVTSTETWSYDAEGRQIGYRTEAWGNVTSCARTWDPEDAPSWTWQEECGGERVRALLNENGVVVDMERFRKDREGNWESEPYNTTENYLDDSQCFITESNTTNDDPNDLWTGREERELDELRRVTRVFNERDGSFPYVYQESRTYDCGDDAE